MKQVQGKKLTPPELGWTKETALKSLESCKSWVSYWQGHEHHHARSTARIEAKRWEVRVIAAEKDVAWFEAQGANDDS